MTTRVVILGSGYAAVWCYRALRRWLHGRVEITVVTKHPHHSFHGFVGDVLGGDMAEHYLNTPLAECFPHAMHVIGEAVMVDPQGKEVTVSQADGHMLTLAYDHVAVMTGAVERSHTVPGLTTYGHGLRNEGAVAKLATRIRVLESQLVAGEVAGYNIVVVGAGFTGTEVSAALARRLGEKVRVHLISASAAVIPGWAGYESTQTQLLAQLQRCGVQLHTNSRVVEVSPTTVRLDNGTAIAADLVISALGNRAVIPEGLEDFRHARTELMMVHRNLWVTDGVWAAGDVADAKRANGLPVIKDALWAIAGGTRVGRNIARVTYGLKPANFNFLGLGAAATFQPGSTVARMLGVPLTGNLPYLLRQALFFWFVPSRRNALRMMQSHVHTAPLLRKLGLNSQG